MRAHFELAREKRERLMSYINGIEVGQHVLFPSTLDECLEEANPVRAITAFIEALDFTALEFVRAREETVWKLRNPTHGGVGRLFRSNLQRRAYRICESHQRKLVDGSDPT